MGQQIPVSKKHVLIMDPNSFAAESLAFLLHCHGHIPEIANSAGEGICSAIGFRPDVVLFDIALAEVSGIDVATAVRSLPGLRNVLIIALTSDSGLKSHSLTTAINLHVIKTDEFSVLRDVIANSGQSINSNGIRWANNNADLSLYTSH